MREKKWYVMSPDCIIVSKEFGTLEEAVEYWKLTTHGYVVVETVFG